MTGPCCASWPAPSRQTVVTGCAAPAGPGPSRPNQAGRSPCSGGSLPGAGSWSPRQKIHAGMIHAGKTATVTCENNCFRVVIDGETAAEVPRTTTSEIHRYKANATDKRYQARLTQEGR